MRRLAYAIIFLFVIIGAVGAEELPKINAIEVRGLKRIEEGAIKAKLSQKIGEAVSQDKTNEDIKAIYRMGYFDDVKVEIEAYEGGARLIYVVKEKPTIIRVDFQGNKDVEDTKLRETVTITAGSIADTTLIQDNAVLIAKYYEKEGYWLTNVVPVINKKTEHEVTLTYQISEGSKVKIKDIVVEGNTSISSRTIKKAMETKEWWLFSFVTSSGYFRRDTLDADMDRIKNLYFNEGFIQVVAAEPEISVNPDKKAMTIKLRISEGDRFRVSSVNVSGNVVHDKEALMKKVTLAPNAVFSKKVLEKDMRAISDLYSQHGYAMVLVTPDLVPNEADKTVRVVINVAEGDQYRIGKIEVSGNTKTRDKVIRREVRLDEGEIFNSEKLKRSYERINNLGFFESVDMVPQPRGEEKIVDVDVKVKERPTGFFSVGGGYSSQDKFIATADITQGNLFGRGQYIKLKGELGGKSAYYEAAFKDPYFLDYPLSMSVGLYRSTREYIKYSKKAFGGYLGFGKSFSEYVRGDITYNYERATIFDIKKDASSIVKDQEGTRTTSSVTTTVTRDSRDNYLDPSRGSRNSVSFTFAGLGGTNAFIKGLIDSGWYFPLGETTFALRGRFGYAQGIFGKKFPLYERFYVGGIYTVRGLGFGDAGPKDPVTDEAIGGTEELIFNTEYIFPIFSDLKMKGVVFFDAGNAYEDFHNFGQLRYTTGAGIRWLSPMGPIRLEWGYNIDRRPGESSNKFEFAFGSFF